MRIKKIYVAGIIGFICLETGYLLVNLFFKTLVDSGLYGLVVLIVFIVTLLWSINYWWSYRIKVRAAEEAAKEVANEKWENDHAVNKDALEADIEKHLLNKLENEKYIIIGKK